MAGCGIVLPGVDIPGRQLSAVGDAAAGDGEPDDGFDQARPVAFDALPDQARRAVFGTAIAPSADVDVYDLGLVMPGDRIVVDVTAERIGFDPVVALFDEAGVLMAENDDRSLAIGQLDPFLDIVARRVAQPLHLAVAAVDGSGEYTVTVDIIPTGEVPPLIGQTVLLDFDGGTIPLPGRRSLRVEMFDAADIDASLADRTQEMKDVIVATVKENFAPFNVVVLDTDQDTPPSDGIFSRVLFGGFSIEAFARSQAVDPFNRDPTDEAIVFTEVFSPDIFFRAATVTRIGRAIGNVASHEIGHLLGLSHVADPTVLMDNVGGPDTLMLDQAFGPGVLDISIFPIGIQDGALLLAETVGLAP